MKKILACILILAAFFTGAAAEPALPGSGTAGGPASGETVIFAATDRHAAYETLKAAGDGTPEEEQTPEGKKPPRAGRIPVYDENGSLIWHNNLTDLMRLVEADGVVPRLVLIGGDFVGSGGDGSRDTTGYPMGSPYFSMKAVDAQVQAVFGGETGTLYTYGSHDANAVDEYREAFSPGRPTAETAMSTAFRSPRWFMIRTGRRQPGNTAERISRTNAAFPPEAPPDYSCRG